MRDLQRWSRLVSLLGGVTLVVGSFDPQEPRAGCPWPGGDRPVVPRNTWNDAAAHRERGTTGDRSSDYDCRRRHRDDHSLCDAASRPRAT
jgi:hypothetical protein